MIYCQWLLVIFLGIRFFVMVYCDFNGSQSREPTGFGGFVCTLIAIALAFTVHFYAGAFSLIFGAGK